MWCWGAGAAATMQAGFKDWWWKARLGKAYYQAPHPTHPPTRPPNGLSSVETSQCVGSQSWRRYISFNEMARARALHAVSPSGPAET